MSFLKGWRSSSESKVTQLDRQKTAAQTLAPPPTPLQLLVKDQEDVPIKLDGSDKFFGMENVVKNNLTDEYEFANTCYCNSIMQCLYASKAFRENVVNFPFRSQFPGNGIKNANVVVGENGINDGNTNGVVSSSTSAVGVNGRAPLSRINTDVGPTSTLGSAAGSTNTPTLKQKTPLSPSNGAPRKTSISGGMYAPPVGPNENKDNPEVKKRAILAQGPVLRLESGNETVYGMKESLFTAMKDIFESIMASDSRTGVISPQRLIDVVKRENEMFRSTMHQDAHEFLNYVLNEVVENVEAHQKKMAAEGKKINGASANSGEMTPKSSTSASSNAGWIHSLFEGLLSSETKCLTCESTSRRSEPFLDLSIDLSAHTSVTSCLRAFSASEMLCERNKFHCDTCNGLQEAEKRMKIKRLPRILALHLKRFKYIEELGRHQKLFHRVVYPYYLRLFNTTDDCDDADRLYELYAVVVHIGGGPYHGHYVAIVKTETKGWLLYDDELVEPVDKGFVRNFFGDGGGLATAYVLFYQETTFEKMMAEMNEEEGAAENAGIPVDEKTPTSTTVASTIASLGHEGRGMPTPDFHTAPTSNPLSTQAEPLAHVPATPSAPVPPEKDPSTPAPAFEPPQRVHTSPFPLSMSHTKKDRDSPSSNTPPTPKDTQKTEKESAMNRLRRSTAGLKWGKKHSVSSPSSGRDEDSGASISTHTSAGGNGNGNTAGNGNASAGLSAPSTNGVSTPVSSPSVAQSEASLPSLLVREGAGPAGAGEGGRAGSTGVVGAGSGIQVKKKRGWGLKKKASAVLSGVGGGGREG